MVSQAELLVLAGLPLFLPIFCVHFYPLPALPLRCLSTPALDMHPLAWFLVKFLTRSNAEALAVAVAASFVQDHSAVLDRGCACCAGFLVGSDGQGCGFWAVTRHAVRVQD